MGGKPSPMLDTAKSLLLRGSNQLAVSYQSRGRIAVKSVQAKNNHRDLRNFNAHRCITSTRKVDDVSGDQLATQQCRRPHELGIGAQPVDIRSCGVSRFAFTCHPFYAQTTLHRTAKAVKAGRKGIDEQAL